MSEMNRTEYLAKNKDKIKDKCHNCQFYFTELYLGVKYPECDLGFDCPYDEEVKTLDNHVQTKQGDVMDEMDEINLPIKHESKPYLMIPLSDEATNGDVIKALFPNDDINPSTITSIIQKIPFGRNEYCSDWWNAPYKRGN